MKRRTSLRLASVLLAPWLALIFAEPIIVRECTMAAVASGQVADAGSMDGMPGMGGAAQTSAPANEHGSPATPPARDLSGLCCVSGCCASAPVALDAAREIAWLNVEVRHEVPVVATVESALDSADHVLPFANGPPAILS